MKLVVGEIVKLNKPRGYELPVIMAVRDNELVLQRNNQKGTLTIPKSRFVKMDKPFRGAVYSYTTTVRVL